MVVGMMMEAPPEHICGKKVFLKWVRVSITTSGSGTNLQSLLSIQYIPQKNKFETCLNLKIQILGCGSMEPTSTQATELMMECFGLRLRGLGHGGKHRKNMG